MAGELTIPVHNFIDPVRKDLFRRPTRLVLQLLVSGLLAVFTAILAMIQLTQKLKAIVHLSAVGAGFPRRIYLRGFLSCHLGIGFDPE